MDHDHVSESIESHLKMLAETIGPRLAGSSNESKAVDYIGDVFKRYGAEVSVESFPVVERQVHHETLHMRLHGSWKQIPCSVISGSPGTDGRIIEAPLTVIEPPELQKESYAEYAGKAVLLLGTHIESPTYYQRLMLAKPAFLILVDIRYPSDNLRADGLFPAYTHQYGSIPTVAIPFMQAWGAHGAELARLMVEGGSRPSTSQNVIATLPGETPGQGPVIFATAHHDTQADSPGADDNGSGVAMILELTRVLAPLKRKRDICLISFGAEEQLSVGSAAYVRSHRQALAKRGGFIFNIDSVGSKMGWYKLHACAEESATTWFSRIMETFDLYAEHCMQAIPYQDAFPFHAAGIPGVWLYRPNCTSGRFYHHQTDDDLAKMDTERMAHLLRPIVKACTTMATMENLPFPITIPACFEDAIRHYWQDCFCGWEGFPAER